MVWNVTELTDILREDFQSIYIETTLLLISLIEVPRLIIKIGMNVIDKHKCCLLLTDFQNFHNI